MAPLKHAALWQGIVDSETYPWLRGHGSIEAGSVASAEQGGMMYPWLRGHGSIEARFCEGDRNHNIGYPWLRGYGSFQADPTIDSHLPRTLEQSDHGFPKFVLRFATIHACKPLDGLTRQGSAHTSVRDLGLLARSSAFGG